MRGAKKTWKGGGWVPSPQQLQLRHAVLPAVCRGQRVCVASSLVWVAGGCAPVRPMAVPCRAVLCVEGSKTRLWKSRAVPALGGGWAAACTGWEWQATSVKSREPRRHQTRRMAPHNSPLHCMHCTVHQQAVPGANSHLLPPPAPARKGQMWRGGKHAARVFLCGRRLLAGGGRGLELHAGSGACLG